MSSPPAGGKHDGLDASQFFPVSIGLSGPEVRRPGGAQPEERHLARDERARLSRISDGELPRRGRLQRAAVGGVRRDLEHLLNGSRVEIGLDPIDTRRQRNLRDGRPLQDCPEEHGGRHGLPDDELEPRADVAPKSHQRHVRLDAHKTVDLRQDTLGGGVGEQDVPQRCGPARRQPSRESGRPPWPPGRRSSRRGSGPSSGKILYVNRGNRFSS